MKDCAEAILSYLVLPRSGCWARRDRPSTEQFIPVRPHSVVENTGSIRGCRLRTGHELTVGPCTLRDYLLIPGRQAV